MSPAEFRRRGHQMIDWIADYWRNIETFPVLSRAKPGETGAKLPEHAPMQGEPDWSAIFRDLNDIVLPGLTHWQHPNFHAFFPANISGPAVLGELLSAGLGVQGMLWATSPACTEIETRVLDWLAEMLELPAAFLSTGENGGGVVQGAASEAALVAMVAARARALGADPGAHLVAYTSTQAHSSIIKAAMIAGLARDPDDRAHARFIGVNQRSEMDTDLLRRAMIEDVATGRTPFFVCATVGTTGCTAIDSIAGAADAIEAAGAAAWLHVDAAHAGAACICPEFRPWLVGIDRADSFCFNPHKWLLTNFDCNCFWTRDRRSVTGALSVTPEYLRNAASESGAVIDYRDWQVPLGRRFRALKLWFVIRHYGVEGLRAHIREHVRLATLLESLVAADDRFRLCAPRTMNLVCFRPTPRPGESDRASDDRTRVLMERLNAGGSMYLTHASLPVDGREAIVIRVAIGAPATTEVHVRRTWASIQDALAP